MSTGADVVKLQIDGQVIVEVEPVGGGDVKERCRGAGKGGAT